jgi:hypothetical protein
MACHRNLIIRTLGLVVMLVGLHKTAWVVYNVFIDAQPTFVESTARSEGVSLVIGVLLVMLGGLLLAWSKPASRQVDTDGLTPAIEETVRELVVQGRTEEAVEAYRAATGADQTAAEATVARLGRAA